MKQSEDLSLLTCAATRTTEADRSFAWVIGSSREDHRSLLDHACLKLFEKPFVELSVSTDRGLRKAFWIDGVLNGHISRFDVDPADPLKIRRHILELLVCDRGLITVDHQGDNQYLEALQDRINQGRVFRSQVSCVGALAGLVIENQLNNNERVLDHLERWADDYADTASSGPLSGYDAHYSLPKLIKTAEFFRRKVAQTGEVLSALHEAARDNPQLFAGKPASPDILRGCEERLKNLVEHADGVIQKLNNIEELHDRQVKAAGDRNIERFTILVGLSAPPMIGDIFCKFFLPASHELHPAIIGVSFLAGVGLMLVAEVPKWVRSGRLWWHRTFHSPSSAPS